jgi:hypothetical protein
MAQLWRYNLDDALKDANSGIRVIVDTVPWMGSQGTGLSADGILKVVLGSSGQVSS